MYIIDRQNEYDLLMNQSEQPLMYVGLQAKGIQGFHQGHKDLLKWAKDKHPDKLLVVRGYVDADKLYSEYGWGRDEANKVSPYNKADCAQWLDNAGADYFIEISRSEFPQYKRDRNRLAMSMLFNLGDTELGSNFESAWSKAAKCMKEDELDISLDNQFKLIVQERITAGLMGLPWYDMQVRGDKDIHSYIIKFVAEKYMGKKVDLMPSVKSKFGFALSSTMSTLKIFNKMTAAEQRNLKQCVEQFQINPESKGRKLDYKWTQEMGIKIYIYTYTFKVGGSIDILKVVGGKNGNA